MTDTILLELTAAAGAALIIVGTAIIYLPAGLITAGLGLLALAAITYAWDGPADQDEPTALPSSTGRRDRDKA